MATSHPLPEGKEEVIPFQGQTNYFLQNDTPLLEPLVGKEWLFPHFPATRALTRVFIFPFYSSNLAPLRKTYSGPEKGWFCPFFTQLHFPPENNIESLK
jgi:hypothetical protein